MCAMQIDFRFIFDVKQKHWDSTTFPPIAKEGITHDPLNCQIYQDFYFIKTILWVLV